MLNGGSWDHHSVTGLAVLTAAGQLRKKSAMRYACLLKGLDQGLLLDRVSQA